MMDDECRGVRQRKKQADPTCCPVCGITVRSHEMQQHYSMEMDRLNKLSVQKYRKSQSKDINMPSPTAGNSSSTASAASTANTSADPKDCWNTYQRIKNNRSARLKLKNRKRRADDPTCPVCNERISDDINLHVELCLRRNGSSSGVNVEDDDDDISIDVEGESYEEYEWAGQTRIRASSMLEGGYTAAGLQTTSMGQSSQNDEDEDLNVDGDDSQIYGEPQYSERDIILPMVDNNKKENVYLRNLVIGEATDKTNSTHSRNGIGSSAFENGDDDFVQPTTSSSFVNHSIAETEIKCESTSSSSRITIDLKDGSVKEVTTVAITNQPSVAQSETAASQIIDALKEKIREYEAIIKNKSKCLICMDEFRVPVVSICCWHVHCEECWLRTLGARKLCPQCNMITSPTDLRKIYM
ncbi:E3 ubiquitin-protein ligase Rnf220 [Contarinia nasturtii]|uniref:E3 ubiquitin-protein ligase Rnf220 n=1 Tax=Contarinia nasturtii TaxID=265458 RepID=UPI0012D372CD|nr:E3 ubiquitin-protein ligase Rnf220 [Contarinia nasturtii]